MVPKKLSPPPIKGQPQKVPTQADIGLASGKSFSVSRGKQTSAQRVLLYGPGGIGKSTLASLAPNPVFLDIESSTRELDVSRFGEDQLNGFNDLRLCIQSDSIDPFDTVVIDSGTKAQEWGLDHTLQNTRTEKGKLVDSIEGYGFGKGYQHLYETFMLLLSDLDAVVRRGKNVIIVAHDCIADVPNPVGDDFIRYEPHFQAPKSGKASIRNRVVQWADHVLFLGYDVISEDGKGKGIGTRTIYTAEMPDHIAKSRRTNVTLPFASSEDGEIWNHIIGGTK